MKFPAVFYPYRSKKLLHALANDMSDVIRKTSTTPNGGNEAKVVTYEDLLKDPEVMESMKKSLGIDDEIMKNGDDYVDGRPSWAGKTLYELLKAPEVIAEKTETIEEEFEEEEVKNPVAESPPPLQPVLTVQHCILEHDNQN